MHLHAYAGTFLIALGSLAFEVALTRLLSVITWYYLAYFAVSFAMLGMTAGAVVVYLRKNEADAGALAKQAANACLLFAVSVPVSLVILCRLKMESEINFIPVTELLSAVFASALPFYFSGIAITIMLTKYILPIGKIYASDLIGAAMGCLLVLAGFNFLTGPGLIILCGSAGVAAALFYRWPDITVKKKAVYAAVFTAMVLFSIIVSLNPGIIRPAFVKGKAENPGALAFEGWNSFSRVVAYKPSIRTAMFWGKSPKYEAPGIAAFVMNIDGMAGTAIEEFRSIKDGEYLRYDLTNAVYYLRPSGGACVIGVGGGRDIKSALVFGQKKITAIDVNPIFTKLLLDDFRYFNRVADFEGVTIVTDEARSYLSRTGEKFSVIQMSLMDTWAATGAGAYTLTENSLYTVEAWKIFLSRLNDDGVLSISRWYSQDIPGETGRALSLAAAVLLDEGKNPAEHISLLVTGNVSTLLICKRPFDKKDLSAINKLEKELGFKVLVVPGRIPENKNPPAEAGGIFVPICTPASEEAGDIERMFIRGLKPAVFTMRNKMFTGILLSRTRDELREATAGMDLDYTPSTDEKPYFFNMLKLDGLGMAFKVKSGPLNGNLKATVALAGLIACLLFFSIVSVIIPLLVKGNNSVSWPDAAYFSLIGAGFMFVELGLIQKLAIFLGRPEYALGIILFTLILSAGAGSFISGRLPLTRVPFIYIYPAAAAAGILIALSFLNKALPAMAGLHMPQKILASILLIAPAGILLGMCFPAGMRIVQERRAQDTPWYMALNGVFGVLCSAMAVFISMYAGISMNFYLAAACYLLLVFFIKFMRE